MKSVMTLIFLVFARLGNTAAQSLQGQVYVMTESLSQDGCKPVIECDCCASDIIFLSNTRFTMIDNCLHNDSFYKGTYEISGDRLTLTFNQMSVIEIYNEESGQIRIEKKKAKINPAIFYIKSCGAYPVVLQRIDVKVLTKAFREGQSSEEKIKKRLVKSKAWPLLK